MSGKSRISKGKYGRAWKRIRDREARLHPFCVVCLANGIKKPTEEIHHIKPLSKGGNHDRNNLVALCHDCHEQAHKQLRMEG